MNPVRHRGRRLACSAVYDGAFTLKVNASDGTFTLPLGTGINYQGVIAWGDGTTDRLTSAPGNVAHTYPAPGVYIIRCWEFWPGGFPRVYFNNGGDKAKVLEIMQWGQNTWTTFLNAFFGCSNMVITANDGWRAKTSTVQSMQAMFRGCTALKPFQPFDTRAVNDMSSLLNSCTAMTSFPFTKTSLVTNFTNMCTVCTGMVGYDFPTLDMRSITNGTTMLYQVNISKASYNSMLDQLAFGRGGIPAAAASSVVFRVDAHYDSSTGGYDGAAARAYLVGTKGWTITGDATP
jgi:hypothetical protein